MTDSQLAQLRQISAETGQSVAELVRIGIELYLRSKDGPQPNAVRVRALQVIGKLDSGFADVAERHDDYFADSIMNHRRLY